jgi:hypothetical protein
MRDATDVSGMCDAWVGSYGCSAAARFSQSGRSKPSLRLNAASIRAAAAGRSAATAVSTPSEIGKDACGWRWEAVAAPQEEQNAAPGAKYSPQLVHRCEPRSFRISWPQIRQNAASLSFLAPQSWQ